MIERVPAPEPLLRMAERDFSPLPVVGPGVARSTRKGMFFGSIFPGKAYKAVEGSSSTGSREGGLLKRPFFAAALS